MVAGIGQVDLGHTSGPAGMRHLHCYVRSYIHWAPLNRITDNRNNRLGESDILSPAEYCLIPAVLKMRR